MNCVEKLVCSCFEHEVRNSSDIQFLFNTSFGYSSGNIDADMETLSFRLDVGFLIDILWILLELFIAC